MRRSILCGLAVLVVASCGNQPNVLRPVDPRIEVCGMGTGVKIGAGAKADLSQVLSDGKGEFSASAEREVRNILIEDLKDKLTGDQIIKVLEIYSNCLRDEASLKGGNITQNANVNGNGKVIQLRDNHAPINVN